MKKQHLKYYLTTGLILAIIGFSSLTTYSTTYYISNSGNDLNSGLSPYTAWRTLDRVNSITPLPGDKILFNRGDKWVGTIKINTSGTEDNPITFGSFGEGVAPVISGFQIITEWTNEGNGIYSKVISIEIVPKLLVIDSIQYGLGREPDNNYLQYENFSGDSLIVDNELSDFPNWTGAEVVISKDGFTLDRNTITNHSNTSLTIKSLGSDKNIVSSGNYFIQNDIRTLDTFGEWYYNINSSKLSVYFGESNPDSVITKLPVIQNLVINASNTNIRIQYLFFEGSNESAISLANGADYCWITDCKVSFSGLDAITISGRYNSVENCHISNVNGSGIIVNGDNTTLSNNIFSNVGTIPGQTNILTNSIAIVVNSDNSVVKYNKIFYVAYYGIYFSSSVNSGIMQYNTVNDACQLIADNSGTYVEQNINGILSSNNRVTNSGKYGIYIENQLGTKNLKTFIYTIQGNTLKTGDEIKLAKFDNVVFHRFNYDDINGNTYSAIKQINPDTKIFLYQYGPFTARDDDTHTTKHMRSIGRWNESRGHSMGNLNINNSKFFLLDAHSNRIFLRSYPTDYLLDFGSGNLIRYWIEATNNDIINQEWIADGIYLDVCTPLIFPYMSGKPVVYSNNLEWTLDMNGFINSIVKNYVGTNLIGINYGSSEYDDGNRAWNMLDTIGNKPYFALEEGAFVTWYGSSKDANFFTADHWKSQLNTLSNIRNYKTFFQSTTTLNPGENGTDNFNQSLTFWDAFWFAMTSFKLGQHNNSYFGFQYNSSAGSYSNMPYFDEYKIDIGNAISEYKSDTINGSEIFLREFENGYVYVNPTNNNVNDISLPGIGRQISYNNFNSDISTLPIIKSFNLMAHRGTIIIKAFIDSIKPTVDQFSIPSVSSDLNVPVLSFTATDNINVTGYLLTNSEIKPAIDDTNWTITAPESYTFSSLGKKIIYAWVRDLAGNISEPVIDTIIIVPAVIQDIELEKGWNIFSIYLKPSNLDLQNILDSLIIQNNLIEVQNGDGKTLLLENNAWNNDIGDLQISQGYKIKVNSTCTLEIKGLSIDLPMIIGLKEGWNLISFPYDGTVNAMDVVQPLINDGILEKVQDEKGESIEYWGNSIGWINGIGNFTSGKGYLVKVSSQGELSILTDYEKSGLIFNDELDSIHFKTVFEGNGFNHMNINIIGLNDVKLQTGDEIAAFDGENCVGVVKLTDKNITTNTVSIIASSSDSEITNGFKEGNNIDLKLWLINSGAEIQIKPTIILGNLIYQNYGSVFLQLKEGDGTKINDINQTKFNIYPNPSTNKITVQLPAIPKEGTKIRVTDITGNLVIIKDAKTVNENLDISKLVSGTYLVKIESIDYNLIKKIIIN